MGTAYKPIVFGKKVIVHKKTLANFLSLPKLKS